MIFLKFIISVRGSLCDYSLWAPKKLSCATVCPCA